MCWAGIVQLGCLIFPKLYTVLFKPEKVSRRNQSIPSLIAVDSVPLEKKKKTWRHLREHDMKDEGVC